MKQIIPFEKDLMFNSGLFEITSISLEHNLKMENNDSIVGNFNIIGSYKENKISFDEKNFNENLLFDITLDDKYDSEKVKIDIDNFYYEIIDSKILRLNIDVLVDNLVYKKDIRCIDEENILDISLDEAVKKLDIEQKEIIENEINEETKIENHIEKNKEEIEVVEKEEQIKNDDIIANINNNIFEGEEKFITYKVHIIRENETIDTIIEKYNVKKEELEKYNVLDNIMYGSKIIVPIDND